ncbi:MAG: hypothetical protein ACYTFX_10435 [Planctomycetota bacterium]|jgi:hypothetical protein
MKLQITLAITITMLVVQALAGGGDSYASVTDSSKITAIEKTLILAMEDSFPDNYFIKEIQGNSWPVHLEKGSGVAVFIADKNIEYRKQQYSSVIWLMPKQYLGKRIIEAQNDPHGPQEPAATFSTETKNFRIYHCPPNVSKFDKKIIEVIEKTDKNLPQNFAAALPNGATVKVLGVCEHPSEGKQWWAPDGTPIEHSFKKITHTYKGSGEDVYELVYGVAGVDEVLTDTRSNNKFYFYDWSDLIDLAKKARLENPDGCYPLLFTRPQGTEHVDVTILVGSDSAWKTIAKMSPVSANSSMRGAHVIIASPWEQGSKARFNIAHDITDQHYRVIAIDRNGKVEFCSKSTPMANDKFCMMTIEFALPLSEIKSVQFQTQKFQSVTFKDISLCPDLKGKK